MTPQRSVGDDLPEKVCDVRPHAELTRAIQGEEKNMARRRMAIPHPSVTGLASGLAVAQYLNAGPSGRTEGGVIKDALEGKLEPAFNSLSKNAISLATSAPGKAVLSSAIVLATAGGIARKWFPSVKLGGSKFYFKI